MRTLAKRTPALLRTQTGQTSASRRFHGYNHPPKRLGRGPPPGPEDGRRGRPLIFSSIFSFAQRQDELKGSWGVGGFELSLGF